MHPARRFSRGEFSSIAISNGRQQVDSDTKMIHLDKNTTSRMISKGISAGRSRTPIVARSRRIDGRPARAISLIATRR